MKVLSVTLASLLYLNACSLAPFGQSNSDYICDVPACDRVAQEISQPQREQTGTPFLINNRLSAALGTFVDIVYQRPDSLILELTDRSKLRSNDISMEKLGFNDDSLTMIDFFDYVFRQDFADLQATKPNRDLLEAVKLWKLLAHGLDSPAYFSFGESTAFFYQSATENYRVIVVNQQTPYEAVSLSLYGFGPDAFIQFVASLTNL